MHISRLVLLVGQAVTLVQGQRWTLHESCTSDGTLQAAIIKTMENVREKTANAVEKLYVSKEDSRGLVKKSAVLPLGNENYNARVDEANEYLFKLLGLEGPIGQPDPSNLLADSFMNHEDWKKLGRPPKEEMSAEDWMKMTHFRDFIIYCAPDIRDDMEDSFGHTHNWDNARDTPIASDNTLFLMKRESDAGKWENPKRKALAITRRDDYTQLNNDVLEPVGERRAIPETITLHPLWLRDLKPMDYEEITKQRIETVTKSTAMAEFRLQGVTPVDALMGLEGTLRHECLHLSAFGRLSDRRGNDAYDWANIITHKDLTNPDTLAYLAMVADLADTDGLTFKKDGSVKK